MQLLYKFISFDHSYWNQPLTDSTLFFSTISDLRKPNDKLEFHYEWKYDSAFFYKFKDDLLKCYDQLFEHTRILCVARKMNLKLWREYCGKNGGICFQFEYLNVDNGIESRRVEYCRSKEHRIPNYLLKKVKPELRRLLKVKYFSSEDSIKLLQFIKNKELNHIFESHIVDELAFKKTQQFNFESEHRFVHVADSFNSKVKIVTPLLSNKLKHSQLGLKLKKVFMTDLTKLNGLQFDSNIKIVDYSHILPKIGDLQKLL